VPDDALLKVRDLHGHYGESHVLHGLSIDIYRGEVVTLLGRNGAGKTTTLKAIMGLLPKRAGSISIAQTETIKLLPFQIARLGIALCPDDRGIFASLSVEENLLLPPVLRPGGMTTEEVYELFPRLYERRSSQGTKLSGGEQQMLAIARILRTGASILLLDEPTEGLAPVIVHQIGDIIQALKKKEFTIILVEQNFHFASQIADRHYVIEHGYVVETMSNAEALSNSARLSELLSV
jgi:branched-chain amino acid transport system ATP-binding protein